MRRWTDTRKRRWPDAVSRRPTGRGECRRKRDQLRQPGFRAVGPIEHVIYIIKENRTYDQVFGKIGKGNGDPSLDSVRRIGRAESLQAGARVCAVRQFLRQRGRERRRAQLGDGGHRSGLHAAAVAEQLRTSLAAITASKAASRPILLRRATSGPTPSRPGSAVRNYGEFVTNKKQAGADGIQIDHVTRSFASGNHEYALSRVRSGLSGRGARQGVSGRPEGIREQRGACRG